MGGSFAHNLPQRLPLSFSPPVQSVKLSQSFTAMLVYCQLWDSMEINYNATISLSLSLFRAR